MRLAFALAAGISLAVAGHASAASLADAEAAFADGRDGETVALYGKAIAESASDARAQARAYFGRGEAHAWFGRPAPAVADFTAALALKQDDAARANTLFSRAEALSSQRAYEAALADYTEALALSPQMVGAHFARGRTLRALNRKDEALAEYEAELKLEPDSFRALTARADLLGLPRPIPVHSAGPAGSAP